MPLAPTQGCSKGKRMDLRELEDLTPARALRERFELEAALNGLPSPVGGQLDAAKQRLLGPGHNGAGLNGQERLQIRYADLMILTRDLNSQEVEVCRLRYHGLTTPQTYEANRRLSELHEGDGEEIIAHDVLDDQGEVMQGWVRVRGVRQRYASFETVAQRMAGEGATNADGQPMTPGAVKRRHVEAMAKVSEAIRWRRFQMMTEAAER